MKIRFYGWVCENSAKNCSLKYQSYFSLQGAALWGARCKKSDSKSFVFVKIFAIFGFYYWKDNLSPFCLIKKSFHDGPKRWKGHDHSGPMEGLADRRANPQKTPAIFCQWLQRPKRCSAMETRHYPRNQSKSDSNSECWLGWTSYSWSQRPD